MSEKGNKFTVFGMILLLLTAAVCSFFGITEEHTAVEARLVEQRQLQHEPEILAENLPHTPSATFRFSTRSVRTLAAVSRIRPWTPSGIDKDTEQLIIKNFPPSVRFELPDNVQAVCTALSSCILPVRAGPEYTFLT